jgi:hypothetical protein
MMQRALLVLLMALSIQGCSRWVRLAAGPPLEARETRAYQVWTGDSALVVRALQVDRDTLRGVVTRRGYCTNCMVAFGLAQVDSVRVRPSTGNGGAFLTGFGMGAVAVWLYLMTEGFGSF